MSTVTTNYGLVKPELTDAADISAMNGNWDKLDTKIKELNDDLEGRFTRLVNNGTVMSQNADYAEVGEWVDGNPSDEDRIGYFVAIDEETSGTKLIKAKSTSDVRGVTVTAPAFSGNCSADKFDSEGNLLKQYDHVAVMGLVSVIDNGTCTVSERCMPADDGTAVPSTNSMGYQVISRIDNTHVLIEVEPSADMLNRIKTQTTEMQAEIDTKCKVVIGTEQPTEKCVLWFNTVWKNTDTDTMRIELDLTDDTNTDLNANVDGADYGVANAVLSSSQSDTYNFEIL